MRPVAYGLGAMLMISGAVALERQTTLRVPAWLVFMGNACHGLIIVTTVIVLQKLHLTEPLTRWDVAACMLGGATVGGIVFHRVVESRLVLWSRQLRASLISVRSPESETPPRVELGGAE